MLKSLAKELKFENLSVTQIIYINLVTTAFAAAAAACAYVLGREDMMEESELKSARSFSAGFKEGRASRSPIEND